jgi:hypothetical protein
MLDREGKFVPVNSTCGVRRHLEIPNAWQVRETSVEKGKKEHSDQIWFIDLIGYPCLLIGLSP